MEPYAPEQSRKKISYPSDVLQQGPVSFRCAFTCNLADVVGIKAHNALAGLDLLCDEGLGRSHKDNLARWIPAVKVVHDDRSNEGLAKALSMQCSLRLRDREEAKRDVKEAE